MVSEWKRSTQYLKKKMNKKWHAGILVVDGLSNVGKELGKKEGGR